MGQIEGLDGVFPNRVPVGSQAHGYQHLARLSRSLDKGRSGAKNYREPSTREGGILAVTTWRLSCMEILVTAVGLVILAISFALVRWGTKD